MKREYKAIAAYYDAEHAGHEYLKQDVPFFLAQIPRHQRVLELGVGTGRAAIPLALAGHRVVGIDRDGEMLAIARGKAEAAGISPGQLKLVEGDMREFEVEGMFDCACIFFNTFLTLVETKQQREILERLHRHLKKRGRLWIDIVAPNVDLMAQRDSVAQDARIFYVPELGRTVMASVEIRNLPTPQLQEVTHRYEWFDASGKRHMERVRFEMTSLFPRELSLLLQSSGFEVEAMYGDYDGGAVTNDSPRIMVMAKKNT